MASDLSSPRDAQEEAQEEDMAAQRKRSRWLLGFGLVLAVSFSYRPLFQLSPASGLPNLPPGIEGAFFTPSQTTPDLILAVFAMLVIGRRRRIAAVLGEGEGSWSAGFLVFIALALNLWSGYTGTPLLLVLSLSLLVMGIGGWLGGRRGFAALRMPALFLLLAYPIPGILLNAWIFPQQLSVASLTADLLSQIGIPARAVGDLIVTPERLFQVIESCAGSRSVMTLLMAGMLYGELFYRSRLQVTLIVVASPFVGLLVNQIRVLFITIVPGSEIAAIHTLQGLMSLVLGVLFLAGLDRLLALFIPPGPPELGPTSVPPDLPGGRPSFPLRKVSILAVLITGVGVSGLLIPHWESPQRAGVPLVQFPYTVKEFRSRGGDFNQEYLGSVRVDEFISRIYETKTGEVELFIGADWRLDPRTSLVSTKVALLNAGARIVEQEPAAIDFGERIGSAYRIADKRRQMLVYHWYENVDSWPIELARSVLSLDRSPLRNRDSIYTVRVATEIGKEADGRAAAEERILQFLETIQPRLHAAGINRS